MERRDTDAKVKLHSEHSWIDGDVPAARVAALQHQRPRWDKSTGHEQGDQKAVLLRSIFCAFDA
jgi:hypothetical protein